MIGPRRLGGTVAVLAGLLAIGLLGGPVGPAALAAALLVPPARWLAPRLALAPWPILTLAVIAGLGAWVAGGGDPRAALGLGLVYLQVHRVLGGTGPADDRVALLLSGLMLVASASATEDPVWMLAWVAWAAALPLGLLPAVPGRASAGVLRLGAVLAGGALGASLALFPLLPRFRMLGDVAEHGTVGFAPDVELGAMDVLLDDPEEVFRVDGIPALPETPLYFRGAVLDAFDGRSWTSGPRGARAEIQAPARFDGNVIVLQFEGTAPDGVLFTAGEVLDVEAEGRVLRRDPHGAWRLDQPEVGSIRWAVAARGPWGPGSVHDAKVTPAQDAYLALPPDLDPRIAALAQQIVGEETDPRRAADAIADWLRGTIAYSRAIGNAGTDAPLSDFLFSRREGHCEYFASAEAVLLRALGHQARLVNGFVAGEPDPVGSGRLVRRYHAHSWAEVYVPRQGWVLVDATPGPRAPGPRPLTEVARQRLATWWRSSVIGFDLGDQREALWTAGSAVQAGLNRPPARAGTLPWVGLGILWMCALGIAFLLDRVLRGVGARLAGEGVDAPQGPVDRAWARARLALEARDVVAPRSLPPLSAARWMGARVAAASGPLEELAWLVYRVRYGGEDASELAPRARELSKEIARIAETAG